MLKCAEEIIGGQFLRREDCHGLLGLSSSGLDLACWWWRTTLAQEDDPGDIGLALLLDSMSRLFTEHAGHDLTAVEAIAHDAVLLWAKRLRQALHNGHVARVQHLHLLADSIAALPQSCTQAGCEALLALLYDPWYAVRRCAAEALGRLGKHVALEKLAPLLQAEAWEQREAAIQILAWQRERVPLPWLLPALEDEQDTVRAAALTALGMRGEVALLEDTLEKNNEFVQQAAYRAIGELGAQAPVTTLLDGIQKAGRYNPEQACSAIDALSMLGKHAIHTHEILSELTQRHPGELQVAALHALDRLGLMVLPEHMADRLEEQTGWPLLNKWGAPHARSLARRLLGKQSTTEKMLELCDSWHLEMRKIALLLLGTSGPAESLSPLRNILQGDFLYYQKQGVIFALEALGLGITPLMLLGMLEESEENNILLKLLNESNTHPQTGVEKAVWALEAWREAIPIESLLSLARNPRSKHRYHALKLLKELGKDVPISIFLEALDAGQPVIRIAIEGVKNRWYDVPVERLLSLLESENKEVRSMALEVLAKLQYQPLVPRLLPLLKDDNERFAAGRALMDLATFVPIEDLMQLFNEGDHYEKTEAVEIMGRMGAQAPLSFLLALLERRAQHVQQVDAKTLLEMDNEEKGDELTDSYLCHSVLKSLGKLGERVPVEPLLNALHDPNAWVVDGALEALQIRGGDIPIADLLSTLHHKSEYTREKVITVLGAIGNPEASDALFETLGDHVRDVRNAAIKALAGMAGKIAVEQCLTALSSRSSSTRAATLTLIAQIREGMPLEPVLACLDDPSVEVRSAAARALVSWGEQVPLKPLLRVLRDPSKYVRMGAIETLAKMGARVPVEPLLACLGDTSEDVRREALLCCFQWRPEILADAVKEASAILRGEEPGPILGALERSLKARVLCDVAQARPEAVALLDEALHWPYWQVRMEGARALGMLEGAIPLTILQRLLALRHDEESAAVREAATEAVETLLAREPDILPM